MSTCPGFKSGIVRTLGSSDNRFLSFFFTSHMASQSWTICDTCVGFRLLHNNDCLFKVSHILSVHYNTCFRILISKTVSMYFSLTLMSIGGFSGIRYSINLFVMSLSTGDVEQCLLST